MDGISSTSVVQTDQLGDNITIGEFSVIRAGVKIGNNVVIHPHVVIEPGVSIGANLEGITSIVGKYYIAVWVVIGVVVVGILLVYLGRRKARV